MLEYGGQGGGGVLYISFRYMDTLMGLNWSLPLDRLLWSKKYKREVEEEAK